MASFRCGTLTRYNTVAAIPPFITARLGSRSGVVQHRKRGSQTEPPRSPHHERSVIGGFTVFNPREKQRIKHDRLSNKPRNMSAPLGKCLSYDSTHGRQASQHACAPIRRIVKSTLMHLWPRNYAVMTQNSLLVIPIALNPVQKLIRSAPCAVNRPLDPI